MKKLLPVELKPLITSRKGDAFQLSVIQSLPYDYEGWLSSQFINLVYDGDMPYRCNFLREDFWFTSCKLFSRQSILLSKDTLGFSTFNTISFICGALDSGSYVMGDFNSFYIPTMSEYNCIHLNNDYLIYGYDMSEEIFYLLGNPVGQLFGSYTVSFNDYINSITNREDGMFNLNLLSVNHDFKFELSISDVYIKISDYLLGECSNEKLYQRDVSYGLKAIEQLRITSNNFVGQGLFLNYRSFLTLIENKRFMCNRADYLIKNGVLSNENVRNMSIENLKRAESVYEACQEYNDHRNYSNAGYINNELISMIDCDKKICEEIISELQLYR